VRYSSIPVVVVPHGMTFGGGCEMSLHADKVVAAET
jgi:3-hydroxyacyl-CoA dehydrogenase